MAGNNDKIPDLTNGEFEKFIKKGLVLIDFFAEWCLAPDTKLTFNPHKGDIDSVQNGSKILSFDKNFKEKYANVKSTFKIISNKKIKITTERGREIICTPEHLILTDEGFCKAENLSKDQLICSYLFNSYPYIEKNNKVFLTEKIIREISESVNLNKLRYINGLKKKGFLNIRYNDEKAYILASLVGFVLTDGSLSNTKNNERMVEFFVSKREDLEEIMRDLKFLGFSPSFREQKIIGEINKRKFTQNIVRVRISRTSFFILLKALGGIEGKKFIEGLKIPNWILNGPKQIQKAFLQGFLGGDGPKVEIRILKRKKYKPYNKVCINPIEFHFHKNSKNDIQQFAKDLSGILKGLGVKTRKIEIKEEERYQRKDKKVSVLLKISLNTDIVSAYNYCSIGFKYSHTKNLASSLAREYLRERLVKIREREKKRTEAIKIKDKLSISEIAKKLEVSYCVVKNWLSGKKANPPKDAIRYDDWLKLYTKKDNIILDRIKSILS